MRDNPPASITNRILRHFWPELLEHVNGQKQLLPDPNNLQPFTETGSWGNVYPTLSKDIVLKITVNNSEEELVNLLLNDPQEGFIRFFDIYKMNADRPSWAIWREEVTQLAEDVIRTDKDLHRFVTRMYNVGDAVNKLADAVLEARFRNLDPLADPSVLKALNEWWKTVNEIQESEIGKAFIHFARKGFLFTDLHKGNIGFGAIGKHWKIIDCHPIQVNEEIMTKFLDSKMIRKNPGNDDILFVVKTNDTFDGVSVEEMRDVAANYVDMLPKNSALRSFVNRGVVTDSLEFEVEEVLNKVNQIAYKTNERVYLKESKVLNALQDMIDNHAARNNPRKDYIRGGKADKMSVHDFDSTQLKIGTKHEREHTSSNAIAREIAMDHLTEDPDYYKKLARMEKRQNPSEDQKLFYWRWGNDGRVRCIEVGSKEQLKDFIKEPFKDRRGTIAGFVFAPDQQSAYDYVLDAKSAVTVAEAQAYFANKVRWNPSVNAKLGYYLADEKEFAKIVYKGMMTTYDPEFGRVVFFGSDPQIVLGKKGKRDQLIRFTFPSDTKKTHRSIYDYNCYSKKPPRAGDIEVYLGGDINDENSWTPVNVLK